MAILRRLAGRVDAALALGVAALMASELQRLVAAAWAFTTDDAYITLRYARHLAAGHGIVWNVGEAPLEGYSNFLYVLVGAGAIAADVDPVVVLKSLGVVAIVATVVAAWSIARTWLSPAAALVPGLLLLRYPGEILWGVSGLETPVYQALVVGSVAVFLRAIGYRAAASAEAVDRPRALAGVDAGGLAVAAVLALLAGITRPEGPMVGIFLAMALAWRVGLDRCSWGLVLAVYALPMAAYQAWRISYFGALLPHSVVCKLDYGGDPAALTRDFWELVGPMAIFALAFPWRRVDARHAILCGVPAAYAALLYGADPIIGHWNRHGLAAYALLLVAAAAGFARIVAVALGSPAARWRDPALVAATLLHVAVARDPEPEIRKRAESYAARMDARERLGAWLDLRVRPAEQVLVGDAGLVPYRVRARVIDAFCLNCREMTAPPIERSAERFASWAFEQRPRFMIVHSSKRERLAPRREYGIFPALAKHPTLASEYQHVATFGAKSDDFHYWVFERLPAGDGAAELRAPG